MLLRVGRIFDLIKISIGVEKGNQLAAAHDELIDRILPGRGNIARMRDDQHFHVIIDFAACQWNLAHIVIALQFRDHCPAWLRPLVHHRHARRAKHRQRGHDTENRLGLFADLRNSARQVIFKQGLALRRHVRNRHALIEMADGQAEVKLLAGAQRLRLNAIEIRRIFRVGIGRRIVFLDNQFATGMGFIFAQ